MTPLSVQDIRNIGLFGHNGAGKTSLLEALLATAGEIASAGSIERGTTHGDFDPQEKDMGHSLFTAITHLQWADHWINLLDAPGLPDLAGRALATLQAVDCAAIVINAQAGIESGTRRMMAAAEDKCRLIIVNKIDANGVDLTPLMASIQHSFGAVCLPINLPSADGNRVIDCFFAPDADVETAFSTVAHAHEAIIDQVVELDEALMAAYLEQGEGLDPAQLHHAFEQALREGHLIPVCFVSARSGAGVSELLDIFARLMPDPTEGNPPRFLTGDGASAQAIDVIPDPNRHVVAHVFEVINDPYRGKLGVFRIHQGTVTPNTQLFIGDARKPFRVSHLLRVQGKNQIEVPLGVPGDICAVTRVDEIHPGAVLHDSHEEDHLYIKPPTYPAPVFGLALIPGKHADEQKLSEALARLQDEDPCIDISFDPQTRHTVIRGLGELHLRILLEQLRSRWNLQLETATPSVPYRETIAATAASRYRHKKQSGGAGQFGEVALRVEPLPHGTGIELDSEIKGGVIPTHFLPAVEKGVHQALAEGALAGYPVQDVRIVLTDGKHHAVDSNEVSFVTAGRHATLEALLAARPLILEPLLQVTVQLDQAHFGEISSELSTRRGRLTDTDSPAPGRTRISAIVPMAEMDGFEARMKAICAGDSEFTQHAAGHEPAPPEVQIRLAQAHSHASAS